MSESTKAFGLHAHDLHHDINKCIQLSNKQYKIYVDSHHRHLEFNISDYVMVHIRPEQFPLGIVRKLQAHSAGRPGPFKVLKLIGPHVYVIDINTTININFLISNKSSSIKKENTQVH